MIYKIRSILISRCFKNGQKKPLLLPIIDKVLDLYESIKHRKTFKGLEDLAIQAEKTAESMAELVEAVDKIKKPAPYKGLKCQ